jgi:hypothetical protein
MHDPQEALKRTTTPQITNLNRFDRSHFTARALHVAMSAFTGRSP